LIDDLCLLHDQEEDLHVDILNNNDFISKSNSDSNECINNEQFEINNKCNCVSNHQFNININFTASCLFDSFNHLNLSKCNKDINENVLSHNLHYGDFIPHDIQFDALCVIFIVF
jgi:hypothetical protein